MESFRQHIERYVSLSDADWQLIQPRLYRLAVSKDRHLVRPPQVCATWYFIEQGCLRLYAPAETLEQTIWIAFADEVTTDLSSFLTGRPTRLCVQAQEDSSLILLAKADLESLCAAIPVFDRFRRLTLEETLVNIIDRTVAFQTQTAEERYRDLLNDPDYLQRIPLKHLATFLGITNSSLSRIRRNLE